MRPIIILIVALLGMVGLTSFSVAAQDSDVQGEIVCPPMPDKSTLKGTNVKSEITGSAGVLSKIKAVDLKIKTETVTTSLFKEFPDVGRLAVLQTLSSTYCSMLKSQAISPEEKVQRWETFQGPILKAMYQ